MMKMMKMKGLWNDLRFALRALIRAPGFTAITIGTLALGIGANTAILSVLNGAFFNPVDYTYPERTLSLRELRESQGDLAPGIAYGNYLDLKEEASMLEAIALLSPRSVVVTVDGGPPERVGGMHVTAEYFRVVGVQPALGRAIAPGEDEFGGELVAVLSHAYWQTRYGGDRDVLGRTLTLDSRSHEIVGVMPRDFRPYWDETSVWMSLSSTPASLNYEDRSNKSFPAMALVREGVEPESAIQELDRIMDRLREAYADNANWTMSSRPILEVARARDTLLLILAAAVGLVLLVACANLANLQLARSSHLHRERAIRLAVGASRARILSASLSENLVLALIGGAVGIGVAFWGVDLLVRLEPRYGVYYDVRPDGLVLLFTVLLSVGTGLLFGLGPAIHAARADPSDALREGDRAGSPGLRSRRLRSFLVVGQVGAAVVLLCGAGLLVRSIGRLSAVDVGFEAASVLTMELQFNEFGDPRMEERIAFYQQVFASLNNVPGVRLAAAATALPFSGAFRLYPVTEEGQSFNDPASEVAINNSVSTEYFEAMGIPIVAGRGFRADDRRGPPVTVVSEALANRVWPGEYAIGRRIRLSRSSTSTVVGVVGSVRRSLDGSFDSEKYFFLDQRYASRVRLVVQTDGDPMNVAGPVREAIQSLDPNLVVWNVMPLTDRIGGSLRDERLLSVLLGIFSLSGLLLACLGIYGVLAYDVSQREREIGIRVALGAGQRSVVRLVLRQGLSLVGLGLGIGLIGAITVSGFAESLLFGVSPLDPVTYLVVSGFVLLVAALSAYLPARRAARLDPVEILQKA